MRDVMYRVSGFARIAGVTVRTLHYYDRIGLLKPSGVTEAGYRLYRTSDLLRLQQIITLKWMGFTLREISDVLTSPSYNLHTSLSIQKAAVEAQIMCLHEVSAALDRTLAEAEQAGTDELDAETVSTIIRHIVVHDHDQWLRQYYSDEAWAGIQARRLAVPPAQITQWRQEWQALFTAFAQHRHEAPESPAVQQLAAQMNRLIELFTGGDPDTQAGLEHFVTDAEQGNLPPEYDGHTPFENCDAELRQLMQQAFTIYRERVPLNENCTTRTT